MAGHPDDCDKPIRPHCARTEVLAVGAKGRASRSSEESPQQQQQQEQQEQSGGDPAQQPCQRPGSSGDDLSHRVATGKSQVHGNPGGEEQNSARQGEEEQSFAQEIVPGGEEEQNFAE